MNEYIKLKIHALNGRPLVMSEMRDDYDVVWFNRRNIVAFSDFRLWTTDGNVWQVSDREDIDAIRIEIMECL